MDDFLCYEAAVGWQGRVGFLCEFLDRKKKCIPDDVLGKMSEVGFSA
jgi:hypothetical protein